MQALTQTQKTIAHKRALRYLSITIFVLMAFPRLRIQVGPVPLYAIDFLIFLTWMYARQIGSTRIPPLRSFVVLILVMAVISEITAGFRMGHLLEPIYFSVRTLLAGSLFFSAHKIIQSKRDLETILKAALPGVVITAALLILTSLPPTRNPVLRYVFSHPFLEPSSESVIQKYTLFYQEEAARGRSLIGVGILSGAFLNTMWPLLLLLRKDATLGLRWRTLLTSTIVLVPIAVAMTYSRGAILGLSLVVMTSVFFASKVRRPTVLGVGLALLVFFWVGWDSEYFYFDRITLTTEAALADPYRNISLDERLFAYVEPFQHVVEHPLFLYIGQGFARWKVSGHHLGEGADAADHAVFAAAYYGYGMLAAFAYMLLLFNGFRMTWKSVRHSQSGFSILYAQALFAGLAGFLSWFMLGHAAVSQRRGAMLLFFTFGLVSSLSNFAQST